MTSAADFQRAVELLRKLSAEHRVVALHAALFWDDRQVEALVGGGGQFAWPSELKPPGGLQ